MSRKTSSRILHASGVETASDNGSALIFLPEEATAYLDVTVFGGTSPTLDVIIEEQDVLSGEWFELIAFTQNTGSVASERKVVGFVASGKVRCSWTITGSAGQTFTFSVSLAGKYNTR